MNKLAIFVEGYTEQFFADSLIREIANKNSVQIVWRKIRGGATVRRKSTLIRADSTITGHSHFVLLFDCGSDEQVKSRMMEEYRNLVTAGYSRIICVRDVRPTVSFAEIGKLEAGLKLFVKTSPIQVEFILSVMEVEAWFLAEHTHFSRIDSTISVAAITRALGFDPSIDDLQLRPHPASDLNACYALAGKAYSKGHDTPKVLDYAHIYLRLVERFPHLRTFCQALTDFLSQ